MKILLFGATGQIGAGVQRVCLNHPKVEIVTSVVRRPSGIDHEKLTEILYRDFHDFTAITDRMRGHDACFWCLGISQMQVDSEQEYREITLEYTLAAADALAGDGGNLTFCFISGMGTDPTMKSRQMWARVKGETEVNLSSYPFKKVYLFRPAFVHPADKNDSRMLYVKLLRPLYPLFETLLPKMIITNEQVGNAMINAVLNQPDQAIFENSDIRKLAGQ
jgi:uncharacterized protein YbjT (DUF2867 family)